MNRGDDARSDPQRQAVGWARRALWGLYGTVHEDLRLCLNVAGDADIEARRGRAGRAGGDAPPPRAELTLDLVRFPADAGPVLTLELGLGIEAELVYVTDALLPPPTPSSRS